MTYHPFGIWTSAATLEKWTGIENPHSPKNNYKSLSLLCPLFNFCDVPVKNLLNQSHKMCNCHLILYFTTQHLVDLFSYIFMSLCIWRGWTLFYEGESVVALYAGIFHDTLTLRSQPMKENLFTANLRGSLLQFNSKLESKPVKHESPSWAVTEIPRHKLLWLPHRFFSIFHSGFCSWYLAIKAL